MQHVHAGTCAECERDFYAIRFDASDARSLGTLVLYHLDEPCAVLPSYNALLKAV
jgi:hypothetical protein